MRTYNFALFFFVVGGFAVHLYPMLQFKSELKFVILWHSAVSAWKVSAHLAPFPFDQVYIRKRWARACTFPA